MPKVNQGIKSQNWLLLQGSSAVSGAVCTPKTCLRSQIKGNSESDVFKDPRKLQVTLE